MAVIYTQPDRWSQLGTALGGGISSGLLQVLVERVRQEQEAAQRQKEAQDIVRLSEVLGAPVPSGYTPQTEAGIDLLRQRAEQQMTPYTLSEGQVRMQGREVIAEAPRTEKYETVEYWDRSGRKRMKRVPESQLEQAVDQIISSGGSLSAPSAPKARWGEPFKVGNQWLQRDPETGRVYTVFKEDVQKPELTPSDALKRISDIEKSKATLEQTNEITAMIVAANPNLSYLAGRKIDPKLKEELFNAWDRELEYLKQFVPPGFMPEPAAKRAKKIRRPMPKVGSAPSEYEYIPGQGLKKVR